MDGDKTPKERVKDLLLNHRGKDNQISSREINDEINVDNVGSFPSTRAIVRNLILEDQIPIVSTNNGYFVAETEEEIAEYVAQLDSRITSIAERRYAIKHAARNWGDGIQPSTDEDIL
jgi:ABC-type uncharacterized transport system ATPase subunit